MLQLLFIHLVDKIIQLPHHAVVPLINVVKLILVGVIDGLAQVAVLHLGKTPFQQLQRLVDQLVDIQQVEEGKNRQQDAAENEHI